MRATAATVHRRCVNEGTSGKGGWRNDQNLDGLVVTFHENQCMLRRKSLNFHLDHCFFVCKRKLVHDPPELHSSGRPALDHAATPCLVSHLVTRAQKPEYNLRSMRTVLPHCSVEESPARAPDCPPPLRARDARPGTGLWTVRKHDASPEVRRTASERAKLNQALI